MATATSKLQIIIDILNGKDSTRTTSQIKAALTSIAAVTGTVVAAGYAAKKAWDFTKEGAQLELTANQFKRVAENAGYLSDTLLNQMRAATDGMVSDAELMRSGLDIIQLGLADSQQGVVDLATVVSRLGLDMQQVILTFANNSEMRLDALGLSVSDVKKRVEELNATGFEGDAFDKAVLEGLTARMELLGDTSETTAGQMQQIETAIQNITEASKRGLSVAFADQISNAASFANAVSVLTDAYERGLISQNAYIVQLGQLSGNREKNAEILDRLILLEEIYQESFKSTTNELQKAPTLLSLVEEAYLKTHMAARDFSLSNELTVTNIIEGASRAESSVSSLAGTFANVGKEASGAIDPVDDLLDGINSNIASPVDAFIQDLEWLINTGGKFEEVFQKIQDADVTPAQKLEWAQIMYDDITKAKDAIDSGDQDSLAGALESLDQITFEIDDLETTKQKAIDIKEELMFLSSQKWVVSAELRWNESGSPKPPTTGSGQSDAEEFASGTGGWATVPGPIGAPYPAILHGGEDMNIGYGARNNSPGGMGGGQVINIYIDTVLDGADFMDVVSDAQMNAGRNARSGAAGAAYVG